MFYKFTLVKSCVFAMFVSSIVSVALAKEHEKETEENTRSKTPVVLQYISVFDDYLPFDEYPDIGWKEANDRVGEIGGWRAYAKLVQEEANRKAEQSEADEQDKQDKQDEQDEQDNGGEKQ